MYKFFLNPWFFFFRCCVYGLFNSVFTSEGFYAFNILEDFLGKVGLENDLWSKINNTFGVKKIVSFGNIPSFVNRHFMNNLISCIDKDGFVNHDFFEFKNKQNVKIKNGPFAGFLAEIIDIDANKRVKVLLDLFKKKTITSLEKKNFLP